MSVIYENTTLSGVSNSAMAMGDIEPPKETDYKTQEDEYETIQFEHNTPQCQTEPVRMDRMGPTKSSVSRKATLLQCSVVILISLAVSTISGVVVHKLTKEDMKDMQLEMQSSLLLASSSTLSNQSESFQDQITLFEKKIRQNVLILEQQMQDNVTVLEQQMKENVTALEQQMKDNVTVLEQQMKDNVTILEQQMKYNVTVLEQQMKDNVTVLEQQMKDNVTVLEQQVKDNDTMLEKQIKDNVNVLEQQMKDNVTMLEHQMKDNVTVLEQQMKDNDNALEQQMKDNDHVLEQQMKDNVTALEQQMKDNDHVLEQHMKDNVTALEQQMKDNVTVLEQQMKYNDNALEQQMKNNDHVLEQQMKDNVTALEQQMKDNASKTDNDINNLKGNMSSKITILNNKLDGVESEQNQLADRFDDRSTSISAFTATQPAYYGRSSFIKYSTLNFSRTIYNLGGDFNSSIGLFTCTKPGTYYFSVFLVKKRDTVRVDQVYCTLYKNYSNIIRTNVDPTDDDTDKGSAQAANSAVIHLNTGDVVYLGGCAPVSYMEYWSSFSGFLLYPDA